MCVGWHIITPKIICTAGVFVNRAHRCTAYTCETYPQTYALILITHQCVTTQHNTADVKTQSQSSAARAFTLEPHAKLYGGIKRGFSEWAPDAKKMNEFDCKYECRCARILCADICKHKDGSFDANATRNQKEPTAQHYILITRVASYVSMFIVIENRCKNKYPGQCRHAS